MRRAGFSLPYTLTIGGRLFNPDKIASISISKNISGIGLGGIVTSQLSATVYADYTFNADDAVIVGGFDGLPTFHIDSQNRNENTVSITAYDRCRKLSLPFDYSGLKDGDKVDDSGDPVYLTVASSQLAGAIANQCGFADATGTGELLTGSISGSGYKDMTCNSIIENMAAASGCYVYCDSENKLHFSRIGVGTSGCTATKHSEIITYPEHRFTRLIASGDKSKNYDIGSGTATNIIEISSQYITDSVVQALAARLFENGGYTYSPVSFNAILTGNVDVYGAVIVGNDSYTVTNISINLCADGAVATLSAPEISESANAYSNLLTRQIKSRVAENCQYGSNIIDKDDGLVYVSGGAYSG